MRYHTFIDASTEVGQQTISGILQNGSEFGVGISSTLAIGGTITELYNGTYWNIVSQADVGIGASQVPLNQYLGQLAFLDAYAPSVVGVGTTSNLTQNATLSFELTDNTTLTIRVKGTDGVVRTGIVTLS
jgi:hypothetical protein